MVQAAGAGDPQQRWSMRSDVMMMAAAQAGENGKLGFCHTGGRLGVGGRMRSCLRTSAYVDYAPS